MSSEYLELTIDKFPLRVRKGLSSQGATYRWMSGRGTAIQCTVLIHARLASSNGALTGRSLLR